MSPSVPLPPAPLPQGAFLGLLVVAHLQAVAVAAAMAWAASRRLPHLGARLAPGAIPLLATGFACFSLAALAETLDHTTTRWLYVNHTSDWNGLFFTGLAAGIALLAAALAPSRRWRAVLLALVPLSAGGYALAGKGPAIAVQTLALLAMLHLWWRTFHDRRLWLYPLFTVGLTTTFGALLNSSGDQIWHLFIGPAGSISLLVLWGIQRRAEGAHHLR